MKYIFILISVSYFIFYNYFLTDLSFYKDLILNYSYISTCINFFNAFLLFFTLIVLFKVIEAKVKIYLNKLLGKTENDLDDLIGEFILKFIRVSKYIVAFYYSVGLLELSEKMSGIFDKLFYVSFIVVALYLTSSLINVLFDRYVLTHPKNSELTKQIFPFLKKAIVIFLWIVGLIMVIDNLGYDVSALITGAGIGGLAFALAAQKSIANIFGAITIIVNKPFKLGDYIGINSFEGTVKDIGLTYLTVLDKNGHIIKIPNENIISSPIQNFTGRENRRVDFAIGVIYDTTLSQLKDGVKIIENLLEELKKDKKIKNYRVNFDSFGDFSLNINATYFSKCKDIVPFLKQKEELNLLIKEKFEKAKIEMAFPTQEVILKKG